MCRLRPHSILTNGHMLIWAPSTCDRFNSCLAVFSFNCGAYWEHRSLRESLYTWHLRPRRHLRPACHTKHDANIAPSDNHASSPCPWRHSQQALSIRHRLYSLLRLAVLPAVHPTTICCAVLQEAAEIGKMGKTWPCASTVVGSATPILRQCATIEIPKALDGLSPVVNIAWATLDNI